MKQFVADHPRCGGRVTFDAANKAEAVEAIRKWYGVSASKTVRRVVQYRKCDRCECSPCMCGAPV